MRRSRSRKAPADTRNIPSPNGHAGNGSPATWPVIDFFSGCGGMSCGFARRPPFRIIAAVDAEMAKPCEGFGKLGCNSTYAANIGIEPIDRNIAELDPEAFFAEVAERTRPRLRRGNLTALVC